MSTVKDSETEMLPRSSVQSSFLQSCIYVLHCLTCLAIIPNQWSILIIDDSDCKLSAIIFLSINALHITQSKLIFLFFGPLHILILMKCGKSNVSIYRRFHMINVAVCGIYWSASWSESVGLALLAMQRGWAGANCYESVCPPAWGHNGAVTAPGNQLASTQVLWQMPTLLSRTSCFSLHSLRYWNIK